MGKLLMDIHKLSWHMDRVMAWNRGEHIAPILIDMALTRRCDARCSWCYSQLQENEGFTITEDVMNRFLEDCARMGVRGIAFLGDGESLLSPAFVPAIQKAASLGIKTAAGSNCHMFAPEKQDATLEHLNYIRINFPAGTLDRYCEIMGVSPLFRARALQNIKHMVWLKRERKLSVTLGFQMVLMPKDADQIIPFVELGRSLGVDYAVIKQCGDDEYGSLGVDYDKYEELIPILKEAQSYATADYQVHVMWSRMLESVPYQKCYGPPFLLQISGTGLVATCGYKFAPQYSRFHLGNICEERWWDIWQSERYWETMNYLASPEFNAKIMCGPNCRQRKINEALDAHKKGHLIQKALPESEPLHVEFI